MLDRVVENFNGPLDKLHDFWFKNKPDIYTPSDAKFYLAQAKDPQYLFGSRELNSENLDDRAKIYSLPSSLLTKINCMIEDAGHVHMAPFIMGTYDMRSQRIQMNDILN